MIELPIKRVKKIYFELNYSSITRRDVEREPGASKANWVKLKGTMTKKKRAKETQYNKRVVNKM